MKDPKEIKINDLVELRREVEDRVRDFVKEECEKFREKTEFSICSISILFLNKTTIGKLTQEHIVDNVECEVDIT